MYKIYSFLTILAYSGICECENIQCDEPTDGNGDGQKTSSGSTQASGAKRKSGQPSSSGEITGGSGSAGRSMGGSGAGGGDDGDDRKKFKPPRTRMLYMSSTDDEDSDEEEELKDKRKSIPIKKRIYRGGCGMVGNFARRMIEQAEEMEAEERHRQNMLRHFHQWERFNASARASVRQHIAEVPPEVHQFTRDENHTDETLPSFTSTFACRVDPPEMRRRSPSRPSTSRQAAEEQQAVGGEDLAVPGCSKTVSKSEPTNEEPPTQSPPPAPDST